MTAIQDVFARNMRKYRKAIGLSQEKLAERAGLHRTYIGGIEQQRVNVSLKNIEKIAIALDVDPLMLFLSTPNPTPAPRQSPQKGTQATTFPVAYGNPSYAIITWTNDTITVQPIFSE